jgi:hypothetical protein
MARARTTSGRGETGFVHGFCDFLWLASAPSLPSLSSLSSPRPKTDEKWNWYMPTRLATLANSKLVQIPSA